MTQMFKKILVFIAIFSLALSASPVGAGNQPSVSLPARAVEVAPNVFSLGTAYDVHSDAFVQGYAIVHKKADARGGNAKPSKGQTCYGYLASGAKWKTLEDWSVFPGAGLSGSFLLSNLSADIAKWETAAGAGVNILGDGTLGSGSPTDPYTLDNLNQVSFGPLDSGTIAVTVYWGILSGPTFNRSLVAWDQIYNTDYEWSDNGEPGKMDFENIATHELGHAVGMDDIYSISCSEVTMYGYGAFGETKKRDLAPADVQGVNALY